MTKAVVTLVENVENTGKEKVETLHPDASAAGFVVFYCAHR
jgi:hypothetical protein